MVHRIAFALVVLGGLAPSLGAESHAVNESPIVAFVGLHGGVFDSLKRYEGQVGLALEYINDDAIANETVDLARYRFVFLQHTRDEDREHLAKLITAGRNRNPDLRIFSISGLAERDIPELAQAGMIESNAQIRGYYGSTPENLRRMLVYIDVAMLGHSGEVSPPEEGECLSGLYHPRHEGLFSDVDSFLKWSHSQHRDVKGSPRCVVAVHSTHLAFQQPKVVDALIAALEKRGVLAVAMTDYGADYETWLRVFRPQAVIHTCHSRESVEFREKLGVPHLHSMFFRKQPIDEWQGSVIGLASSELAFHIIGQELLGAIEPQAGAGTTQGGGSAEAFEPIDDRIDHLADRAAAWMRLARIPHAEKKIAFVYYDRDMGQSELMRGSATGMFMNAPRSLVKILARMNEEGYDISQVPSSEDELLAWMQEKGRQIGIWAPGVLDRLARSGQTTLVPSATYLKWFESKVPEKQRRDVIARWGEPPGRFLVWENGVEQFIVIPKIDLGNVTLLPQPLRGEAHDTSLVHNKLVPPPHNYLATYFWLQEALQPDAVVHFGTHGTEFLLPGKPNALSRSDWPDIIMGALPNINPWIINNLGESSPVCRRAYAVLIDHLVPPSINAELSDELLNLHNDIDKWAILEEGTLKHKFADTITRQVRETHLDRDLHLGLAADQRLTPEQIEQVLGYLHDIHNETTPISLHVFGEAPPAELLVPWLVTCLGKRFLDALGEVIEVPDEESHNTGDREKYLRSRGAEAVRLIVHERIAPMDALTAVGAVVPASGLPEELDKCVDLAERLADGFGSTHQEVDNLLAAFDGRYIPPGPANSPDRNPGVLPTGRNMFVINPEEVPSRPSWGIAVQLVDQLLGEQVERKGRYPGKIAFTLNSFATFQDFGVMEAEILYVMGVRPIWDEKNCVTDVELIPAAELGRPRIDVFISCLGYYRDTLPSRMHLLDKAIRLVAGTSEPDNYVHANSVQVQEELTAGGLSSDQADTLSLARIFGSPLGQTGVGAGYYYLVERSGEWDTREDFMETYLANARHVYTEGMWGDDAPETYDRHIQGCEVLLRSWSDRTRSPLSNKYDWYKGGSLSLAIKHLTGKEPDWFFSDVRDPDRASMIDAEDALRREYRVRLFNRKWIEGMMKEGYAGADQVAVHVSNTMGWKIMREDSVSDDTWEEIVNTYIRDNRNLHIREWFEAENPHAFQEVTEILLETVRKGYWRPDESTLREIATEYARSVARHGENGGFRGGGNTELEGFVESVLRAPGDPALEALLAEYQQRARESSEAPQSSRLGAVVSAPAKRSERIEGRELVPQEMPPKKERDGVRPWHPLAITLALLCLLLVALGYRFGRGRS